LIKKIPLPLAGGFFLGMKQFLNCADAQFDTWGVGAGEVSVFDFGDTYTS
jgi:hypothetical protein